MNKLEFNPAIVALSIVGEEMPEGTEILASVKREGAISFSVVERSEAVPAALAAVSGRSHRRNKKLMNGRYLSLVYMKYCGCYQIHMKRLCPPKGFDKKALGTAIGRELSEALAIIFDQLKTQK